MQSKQINHKNTKLLRIDAEMHHLLKIKASSDSMTLKGLVEGKLGELLEVKSRLI